VRWPRAELRLQEARKYRLTLVLATQGIEQLSKEAAFAVFTNCATLISFRVSYSDATRLKDEFAMVMHASNLQDLPDYKMYVRTLSQANVTVASSPSGPHLVAAYPPFPKERNSASREYILRATYQRYSKSRSTIDARISRFLLNEDRATQRLCIRRPR